MRARGVLIPQSTPSKTAFSQGPYQVAESNMSTEASKGWKFHTRFRFILCPG